MRIYQYISVYINVHLITVMSPVWDFRAGGKTRADAKGQSTEAEKSWDPFLPWLRVNRCIVMYSGV